MDFVMDALADGRRLKILTIVDDFTKEAIDIVVDCSIPGVRGALSETRGTVPGCAQSDPNRPGAGVHG